MSELHRGGKPSFHFEQLPVSEIRAPRDARMPAEGPPPIVLVVHHDPGVRDTYASALDSSGMWVATAADPAEALEAVDDLRPDAIVIEADSASAWTVEDLRVVVVSDSGLEPQVLVHRVREELTRTNAGAAGRAALTQRRRAAADAPSPAHDVETDRTARRCPECGGKLEWMERRPVGGREYDYYRWCVKGCGLRCYDVAARTWVKLV